MPHLSPSGHGAGTCLPTAMYSWGSFDAQSVSRGFFFSSLLAIGMVLLDVKPEKHTGDLSVNALLFTKTFPRSSLVILRRL